MAAKKKTTRKKTARKKAAGKRAATKNKGGAPKGNEFWKARSSHGRKPIFETPELLETACLEYFEWVEQNPLYESKTVAYKGRLKIEQVPKMRAMTIDGLCVFLDIGRRTWDDYAKREDFSPVTSHIETIMRTQKFAGAAADLLNANIIARDLGLKDKKELSTPDGKPLVQVYLPDNGR